MPPMRSRVEAAQSRNPHVSEMQIAVVGQSKMKSTELIIAHLDKDAETYGMAITREACKKFLLRKTLAGGGTKRKPISRKWIQEAYAKQGGMCHRCGDYMELPDVAGDHLIALALGGKHTRNNIRAMHRSCNAKKGAASLSTESKRTGKTVMEQLRNG